MKVSFTKKIIPILLSLLVLSTFYISIQTASATIGSDQDLEFRAAKANVASTGTGEPSANIDSCSSWWSFSIKGCFNAFVALLGALAMSITALFLALAGFVLNYAVEWTVINMRLHISAISGINTVWIIFRDLANVLLIFILLYIAIGTVLDLSSVNMKKMLRNVILIAILMNFSLFFTRVLIDTSNILSIGFYDAIPKGEGVSIAGNNINIGLSGAFMQSMGISSIWDVQGATAALTGTGDHRNGLLQIVLISFFASMMFLVAGFVFFAAFVMFAYRYIVLIFLMMFSPLAFASMALPSDKYSGQFWSTLMKQCLMAPIFLAIVWATLAVLRKGILSGPLGPNGLPTTDPTNATFAAAFSNLSSGTGIDAAASLFFNFIIIIGMFVFALVASKSFGAAGAKWGMDKIQGLRKGTQGVLGRAAVRVSGVNAVDRALKKGAERLPFGNYYADQFRKATTGSLVKQKFGSKDSVDEVDKDAKRYYEKRAGNLSEKVSDELDKSSKKTGTAAAYAEVNDIKAHEEKVKETNARVSTQRTKTEDVRRQAAVIPGMEEELKKEEEVLKKLESDMKKAENDLETAKEGGHEPGDGLINQKIAQARAAAKNEKAESYQNAEDSRVRKAAIVAGKTAGYAAAGAVVAGPIGAAVGAAAGLVIGAAGWYGNKNERRLAMRKQMRGGKKKGGGGSGDKKDKDVDDLMDDLEDMDEDEREKYLAKFNKKYGAEHE